MRNIQIVGAGSSHIPVVFASKLRRFAHTIIVITCNPEVDHPLIVEDPQKIKKLSYQKFTKPYGHKR